MKTAAILVCAFLGAVHAQDINALPECGRTCIQNMIAEQDNLGCPPVQGQTDVNCLCRNANFSFGLRDCSTQACGSDVADAVVAYGVSYCNSAGVAIPTTIVTSGASAVPGDSAAPTAGAPSAIATSTFVATITADGSTFTTAAASTLFGSGSAPSPASSAASEASPSVSSPVASASSAASSAVNSASVATSASKNVGFAPSSAAGQATSSTGGGFASQMTAAPAVGFLAAAGVAAMLL